MDLLQLVQILAEEEEEGTAISKAGFFSDYMAVIGIVLALVGIAIIYVGIKLMRGYSFHVDETVVVDEKDDYTAAEAEVLGQRSTPMPDLSGEGKEKLISEIRLRYEAGDTVYTEWILGSGNSGDKVRIRYNEEDPTDFFLDDEDPEEQPETAETEEPEPEGKSSAGITLTGIGLMVLGIGIFVFIDGLSK
ncbi:MAG: hypothetical protein IKO44_04485 [Ruminococcus sp.]|nr:hypothetical protein [Ruminococcus sp.]MBR4622777.1 hypothetical protein [Ruminococcus sp.]